MGPGIRVRPLAANRESPTVPESSVAPDVHQALDIHRGLGPKGSLDLVLPFDLLSEEVDLLVVQILGPAARIDAAGIQNLACASTPDPVDIGQGDLDSLASGQINTRNTCHQFVSAVFSNKERPHTKNTWA